MKSGIIGLVGRPNVGKSTLVNSIVGRKVAIVSDKAQTTRNLIQGIYNDADSQIVLMDTPGIHKPNHKLGDYLNKEAYYSINDVDAIMFLVPANESIGGGDKFIIEKLKEAGKPVILVINKVDTIKKDELLEKIDNYKDLYSFSDIVPVSALKKDNVDTLISVLKNYLTDDVKYYDDDYYTNKSTNFMIAEIVREKIMQNTHEEVPHSVTCIVENVEKHNNALEISVAIIVDRDSLKRIIIGKQGSMLKEIGSKARVDIEELLDRKVFLKLYVKTMSKWRDKMSYLKELGFYDIDE
ncbi:MAG: GTPase Era [Bacilli bacterium]|nr:GTPase Era [Bacilli bacterium]